MFKTEKEIIHLISEAGQNKEGKIEELLLILLDKQNFLTLKSISDEKIFLTLFQLLKTQENNNVAKLILTKIYLEGWGKDEKNNLVVSNCHVASEIFQSIQNISSELQSYYTDLKNLLSSEVKNQMASYHEEILSYDKDQVLSKLAISKIKKGIYYTNFLSMFDDNKESYKTMVLNLIQSSNKNNVVWERDIELASNILKVFKESNLTEMQWLEVLYIVLYLDKNNQYAITKLKDYKEKHNASDYLFLRFLDVHRIAEIKTKFTVNEQTAEHKFYTWLSDKNFNLILMAINNNVLNLEKLFDLYFLEKEKKQDVTVFFPFYAYVIMQYQHIKGFNKEAFSLFAQIIKEPGFLKFFSTLSSNKAIYMNLSEIFYQNNLFEESLAYCIQIADDIAGFKKIMDMCSDKKRLESVTNVKILCSALKGCIHHIKQSSAGTKNICERISELLADDDNYSYFFEFAFYGVSTKNSTERRDQMVKNVYNLLVSNNKLNAKLGLINLYISGCGDYYPTNIKKAIQLFINIMSKEKDNLEELIKKEQLFLSIYYGYLKQSYPKQYTMYPKVLHTKENNAYFLNYCKLWLKYHNFKEIKIEQYSSLPLLLDKCISYYNQAKESLIVQQLCCLSLLLAPNDKQMFEEKLTKYKKYLPEDWSQKLTHNIEVVDIKKTLINLISQPKNDKDFSGKQQLIELNNYISPFEQTF